MKNKGIFNLFSIFQVSPSNILLFHLGIIESLLCVVFLVFSVPLLTRSDENVAVNTICKLDAFFLTLLHPIALWTVCGLNCDRYYAISAPLHYNAIVSSKKVRKIKIQLRIFNFTETVRFISCRNFPLSKE